MFALWEPPLTELHGEKGAPVRRTATAEAADLLTDLTVQGVRSVAFVRSRRGAELISVISQERLAEVDRSLARRVAAYRGGYLPEERRALEQALHSGELLGLAATNALELGIDISGLDAVVIAGYPGTRASLWQQAGRAGRSGQGALAVLVARDDPLDTFLVHHPEALFDQPVESTVLDPDNPYVLAPHLCAAAAELPLTDEDLALFGPASEGLLPQLEAAKLLRRRTKAWHWTRRERAADLTDIRGEGGRPVQVVETGTGRLLGTVDAGAAHSTVHEGAVHLHQGRTYLVRSLDLEDSVALVEEAAPPYSTVARDTTSISVLETDVEIPWGDGRLCYGSVEVTNQVVSFLRRRLITGEVLGETKLDLPPRTLRTRAVWWTVTEDQLDRARINPEILGGALHAAEHASIGLLPLFATCDRWDIGGVSIPLHPDTLLPTVFVYDGHPGGAGFAERAFHTARTWLTATRQAIASCECDAGCPSCIQSPKCGNGNDPLHKRGPCGSSRCCWRALRRRRRARPRRRRALRRRKRWTRHRSGGRESRRRPRPRPDLRRERPPSRRRRHVRDLPGDLAAHEPHALGPSHPAGPGAGRRSTVGPVVRRGQRREIRTARRSMPDDDGLPERQDDSEHHTQNGDRPNAPHGGGPLVRTGAPDTGTPPAPSHVPTASSTDATASSRTAKDRPRSTGGSATTVTRTCSVPRLTVTFAPGGAASRVSFTTAPGGSWRAAARAPVRAASTHWICAATTSSPHTSAIANITSTGSTTADSAVTNPRSAPRSHPRIEGVLHDVLEFRADRAARDDLVEHHGERHRRDDYLGFPKSFRHVRQVW